MLIVDDDVSIRRALGRELERSGFSVREACDAEEGYAALRRRETEVVLLDIRLPGASGVEALGEIRRRWPEVEVVMLTGHGDVETAVECMRQGAHDFLQKPCHLGELETALSRAIEKHRLAEQNRDLKRRIGRPTVAPGVELIGRSRAIEDLRALIARVAPTNVSLIITGDSGTGKEVVARQVVSQSQRASEPFMAINCGALTETLLESELFGHERGAFTGADERRLGFFELANRGTILLDEIGEMPAAMQAKLLRVIQFGEFFRVGSTEVHRTDVRIIAATNRDLAAEVEAGRFREDLLYRLNTVMIHVPPLRERPDDLPDLIEHILAHEMDDVGVTDVSLTPEALECLRQHSWPGNVRELENALRSAAIMSAGEPIRPEHLPQHMRCGEAAHPAEGGEVTLSLDEIERRHILAVLDDCGGNKAEAARRLGITKKTLYSRLVLYGRHVRGEG
ncbi:sigma-54-dependent Fis family transcriptional regulator [Candidatus Sumerlaeota bacterium]|nr:sigma-54-dependent Fis family transcriptional regulator [Candidatus Sumerlaeota bacterium]